MLADPVDELDAELSEGAFTDAELTELALSEDPEGPLAADAVPLAAYLSRTAYLLPQWYMPATTARCGGSRSRWRTPIIVAIIVAFLLIDAWGLCSTYGQIVIA